MSYYLKRASQTIWAIQKSAQKIGSVMPSKERPGQFVGVVDGVKTYGSSANEVFEEIVARLNRVSLCGEDDVAKARAEVERRNEETIRQAKEMNEMLAGTGMSIRVRRGRKFLI